MKSTGRKYSQEEKPSGPLPDFPKFERYTDVTIGDNVITCPVYYWKDNSVLPFPMPKPGTVKLRVKKQDITYLKIYSGFDIETSNVDIPKNDKGDVSHLAFMYHWQFSFVSDSSARTHNNLAPRRKHIQRAFKIGDLNGSRAVRHLNDWRRKRRLVIDLMRNDNRKQ